MESDYIINPFTGERETPQFSKFWFNLKSDELISLVLKHVQTLTEDAWLQFRQNACKSEPHNWVPVVQDYKKEEILAMSRESVVHKSCTWMGIGKSDVALPFSDRELIGELDSEPVWYYPEWGGYYWLEPKSDELITITLSYPLELH